MSSKYVNLKGKTKKVVLETLGDEFNFFYSDVWSYQLNSKFFKRKLILIFKENKVKKAKVIWYL